ncbi:hypothetical protein LEM8419_00923 [Neolewinella maritima]|uniref:Outer membrane protein beta-barrel domain-containing protein n=1 Tax=Neolewinella maritima TaxID=1383882 RepID=A0ABM9AZ66_9BACT|nr:hypothetical protein [Neolewinella maritima]CAH0999623.1 hypothetical protein LEM8419_00923 [Neolewinella maritima]
MRTFFLLCCLAPVLLCAQLIEEEGVYGEDWGGYFYGLRGGLGLGSQDWSNIETELNLGFHGDVFYETLSPNSSFSFWAQLGYHQRGSRISRRRVLTFQGNQIRLPADDFVFNNISLALGGKQVVSFLGLADLYYLLGVRAEYNVSTNLGEYDRLNSTQGGLAFRQDYPVDSYEFINRFVYGVSAGGGLNMPLTDRLGGYVELVVQPDLNFQYNQGAINNVLNPAGPGNRTIGERAIRNVTIELSVGLRLLRKWTYVD